MKTSKLFSFKKTGKKSSIHGGIRTHDLWIRSPTRYPLRYADLVTIDCYSMDHNIFITESRAFRFLGGHILYTFSEKITEGKMNPQDILFPTNKQSK